MIKYNKIKTLCPKCKLNCVDKKHQAFFSSSIHGFFQEMMGSTVFVLTDMGTQLFYKQFKK